MHICTLFENSPCILLKLWVTLRWSGLRLCSVKL